jgi:hypothetical protein
VDISQRTARQARAIAVGLLLLGVGSVDAQSQTQPAAQAGTAAGTSGSAQVATNGGGFYSSLKQAFSEDFDHDLVRGHIDVGSPPDTHRYYCLVSPKTGKAAPNAVAGDLVHRHDGMTGIKGAAVTPWSCADAEQKGLLVTTGYVLKGKAAAGAPAAAPPPTAAATQPSAPPAQSIAAAPALSAPVAAAPAAAAPAAAAAAATTAAAATSSAATAATVAREKTDSAPAIVREMVGSWSVEEWMWSGAGAQAVVLPAAVAQRQLIGDAFIQETMSAASGAKDPFTRVAYFGYNPVARQYEYFSLDTRAPQMMNERSFDAGGGASPSKGVNLLGGTFVAPQWGDLSNAAFRYRIVVGPVHDDRQEVELYLTPLTSASQAEFLAFRYVYKRRR